MRQLRVALFSLALVIAPALALAAAPLTPAQVENFIAIAPQLQTLAESHAEEFDGEAFQTLNANAFIEALQAAGIAQEFETLAKGHGFATSYEAADVMRRIMTAFLAVDGGGDPRGDLKEAREQIMADKDMDEAERKEALDDLAATEAAFADVETDKPVIQPYVEKLRPIFGGLVGEAE
jgi:hypothetical protein